MGMKDGQRAHRPKRPLSRADRPEECVAREHASTRRDVSPLSAAPAQRELFCIARGGEPYSRALGLLESFRQSLRRRRHSAPPARRCAHINVAQQDAPQSDQQPLSRLTPQIKGHILKMKSADGPCCPLCGLRFAEIEDQRAHLWITFPQAPRRRSGLAKPLGSGALAPHHIYCSGGHQPAGPHVDSRMSRVTISDDPTWRVLSRGSIRDALSV